jgi:hypothetical protein
LSAQGQPLRHQPSLHIFPTVVQSTCDNNLFAAPSNCNASLARLAFAMLSAKHRKRVAKKSGIMFVISVNNTAIAALVAGITRMLAWFLTRVIMTYNSSQLNKSAFAPKDLEISIRALT